MANVNHWKKNHNRPLVPYPHPKKTHCLCVTHTFHWGHLQLLFRHIRNSIESGQKSFRRGRRRTLNLNWNMGSFRQFQTMGGIYLYAHNHSPTKISETVWVRKQWKGYGRTTFYSSIKNYKVYSKAQITKAICSYKIDAVLTESRPPASASSMHNMQQILVQQV